MTREAPPYASFANVSLFTMIAACCVVAKLPFENLQGFSLIPTPFDPRTIPFDPLFQPPATKLGAVQPDNIPFVLPPTPASGPCRLEGINEMFNFASFSAGAQVLSSSPGLKSPDKTLVTDSDSYMSTLCSLQSKWFVIQLSEDIEVSAISITSREHYSSGVEYFQLLGSDQHPTPEWILMGYFRAENSMAEQVFCIEQKVTVRYLKIRLLSHYGNEQYCTLNSVKVYGSRLIEALWRMLDVTVKESKEVLDDISSMGLEKDVPANLLPERDRLSSENLIENNQIASGDVETPVKPSAVKDSEPTQPAPDSAGPPSASIHPLPQPLAPAPSRDYGGPQQNIITKLTNRIKDLEINQRLANRAVEKLGQSLSNTVNKLESGIRSMDSILVARDQSIQSLLASAVETTNASTSTILLLRRQLAALNSAYDSAESTLRILRFALAIAVVVICVSIVAALFRTSSGPSHVDSGNRIPIRQTQSATPFPRRRRRARNGRLSAIQSTDLVEHPSTPRLIRKLSNPDLTMVHPAKHFRSISDDISTSINATPRVIRQYSQPFLSSNKFDALLFSDSESTDSD